MDQDSFGRSRRRSLRNLRRSSGYFMPPCTTETDVREFDFVPGQNSGISSYGSVWIEEADVEKSYGQCVVDGLEMTRQYTKDDVSVMSHCCTEKTSFPLRILSELGAADSVSPTEVPSDCQTLVGEGCNTDHMPQEVNASKDFSSLSMTDMQVEFIEPPESRGMDFSNGTAQPQNNTGPVSSYTDSKGACDRVYHEGTSSVTEILRTFTARVEENINMNLEYEYIPNNIYISYLLHEECNNAENIKTGALDYRTESQNTSRKATEKSEKQEQNPDMHKYSESCEPRKKKRLSLKKNAVTPCEERDMKRDVASDVGERGRKSKPVSATKSQLLHINKDEYISCVSDDKSTLTVETDKCTANKENHKHVGVVVATEEIYKSSDIADKFFDFSDLQTTVNEVREMKNEKSKAKARRRCSRLFSLHEMPLSELASEQSPYTRASLNSASSPSTKLSVATSYAEEVASSIREFSSGFTENIMKGNILTEQSDAPSIQDREMFPDSFMKDEGVIEEVIDDFAAISVSEDMDTDIHHDTKLSHKKTERRWSRGVNMTYTVSDGIDNSKDDCLVSDKQAGFINSSHGISRSTNILSNNATHLVQVVPVNYGSKDSHEFATRGIDDGQHHLDKVFSVPSVAADLDELPSHENLPVEHETTSDDQCQPSYHMRIRRSRRSWDMTQHATLKAKISHGLEGHTQAVTEEPATEIDISTGLKNLYCNKNYVPPKLRSWETIKECPKANQPFFTKQRHKCLIAFEAGITHAKLQRRHKKAVDLYRRIGEKPTAITDDEFQKKMLDVKLFLDNC